MSMLCSRLTWNADTRRRFDLLYLSFGIATAVLLLVEYIRLFRVPPLGKALHGFMSAYLDHRDDGPLILTHIYLLLGCAIPVWMCGSGPTARPLHGGQTTWGVGGLAPYAGIISLGVGDAAVRALASRSLSAWHSRYLLATRPRVLGPCTAGIDGGAPTKPLKAPLRPLRQCWRPQQGFTLSRYDAVGG